jgi:magnesium transporter
VWLNVEGLADIGLIERLARVFDLHALAVEDVVNTHQRPKVDEYPKHLFIVAREVMTADFDASDQVTLFLGSGFLLTFQEHAGTGLEPVRERLRKAGNLLRLGGADYLAYAILDTIIDGYFPVLERYGEAIETLEREVVDTGSDVAIGRIYATKHDLLQLRRAVWPQRDMLNALAREKLPFVSEATRPYLRDCYDHCIQLMDMLETFRDVASGLMELHLAAVSNRMNEVMKVLTVISTIFIPLSFIAGVYGMNFDRDASRWNMPELGWVYGYPFSLGLMLLTALILLLYFQRRGWLARRRPGPPGSARERGRDA